MRRFAAIGLLVLLGGCGGGGGSATPFITAPPPSLSFDPAPLALTSNAPVGTITGQGDVAGVQYTPHAAPSCTGANGAIAVAGDGVAQTDVAGSPLLFLILASGTPPSSCNVTISGSDGSTATEELDFSTVVVDTSDRTMGQVQHISMSGGSVVPGSVTVTSSTTTLSVQASGFSGLTKSSVNCAGAQGGVTVIPSSFTGAGTITIAPYGQGALSGTCTVTFTDAASNVAKLNVTLGAAALQKLTVNPTSVQFACAGSSPQTCTTANVAISENGAKTFRVNTRPAIVGTCANAFNGPLKMTTGNGVYSSSVSGPQASVQFYGLLLTPTLNCTKVVIGDGTQTTHVNVNSQLAMGTSVGQAQTCTGTDPLVPVPSAPHGMYVWNPWFVNGGNYEPILESKVIGKDPSLCGVSLVVRWSDVETSKGVYSFKQIDTWAAPYVAAGLRVNLLFADAPEVGTTNKVTPAWVSAANGDNVGVIQCPGQVPYPNWLDPKFEADYEDFIKTMVAEFSSNGGSSYAKNIGYMRFGIGAGVESYPGHIEGPNQTPHPCLDAWAKASPAFSYNAWLTHTLNIVQFIGAQKTDKQLMIALNYVSTYDPSNPNDTYTYANAVSAVAAPLGIAFGTENLGISAVAAAATPPAACNPSLQKVNLYWCQAFNRHLGVVPFEFQPIVSPLNPGTYDVTIDHLLQVALDNNAQILELYPQDWIYNNDASQFPGFSETQAQYNTAFMNTSFVLGRSK